MENQYALSDIIEKYIPGDWGEDCCTEDAKCPVSCIRGADIVPIENNDYKGIPIRWISAKSLNTRRLSQGDIIIEKSGGSPIQSTGRVVFVSQDLIKEKRDIVCSNFCSAFRIKEGWNPKYVYYYLKHVYNSGIFFNFEGKTSGLKNLQMEIAFKSLSIEKKSLREQSAIVDSLSTIERKLAVNRQINENLAC